MTRRIERLSRTDPRAAVRRDRKRMGRRDKGQRSFWRSLGVIGMVGWPIAISSVGGAILGRYLDARWGTGIRFTLMLLMIGVLLGCLASWKAIVQKNG